MRKKFLVMPNSVSVVASVLDETPTMYRVLWISVAMGEEPIILGNAKSAAVEEFPKILFTNALEFDNLEKAQEQVLQQSRNQIKTKGDYNV